MARHVALLRAINVGGKNIIKMADLKRAFEDAGFTDVTTYIQSGNVLFSSRERSAARLEPKIERLLRDTFRYEARVVVRSRSDVQKVIDGAPPSWPDPAVRCNVIFLKAPLAPAAAAGEVQPRAGVDTVHQGPRVLYVGTRKDALAQSALPRLTGRPAYRSMTIRTYGTVNKILERL